MARIRKWAGGYIDPKSGSYFIQRTMGGKDYHLSTRQKSHDGALAFLAEWEKSLVTGKPLLPAALAGRNEGHPFDSAVLLYLEWARYTKGNGEKHCQAQAGYFDTWAMYFASLTPPVTVLEHITPALVDAFVAWRRKGGREFAVAAKHERTVDKPRSVGPHAVALDVAAIKTLFVWASRPKEKGGFLDSDPLARYPIPKRPKYSSKPKYFDEAWWKAVRQELLPKWQLAGDVLLGSGMRYSSLQRLQPGDVDVRSGTLTLAGNVIKGKVGLTSYVANGVAAAAKLLSQNRLPAESTDMNHAIGRACAFLDLPYFSVHAFRHTFACWAIDDGVSLGELQKLMGHTDLATTERYIHWLGKAKTMYRGRYKGHDAKESNGADSP